MDPPNLQIIAGLIPWPYWLVLGLAVGWGYILLLVWAGLVVAKEADRHIMNQRDEGR